MGNRNRLTSNTTCPQVTIVVEGHQFTLDLFQLPLYGADIVLKVQWLQNLGPIMTDYTSLTMSFTHLGRPITLQADVPLCPDSASAHQLKRYVHIQSLSTLFHLVQIPDPEPQHPLGPLAPLVSPSLPPVITTLSSRFDSFFQEPSQLLPPVQSPTTSTSHPTPNQWT